MCTAILFYFIENIFFKLLIGHKLQLKNISNGTCKSKKQHIQSLLPNLEIITFNFYFPILLSQSDILFLDYYVKFIFLNFMYAIKIIFDSFNKHWDGQKVPLGFSK